MTKPKTANPEFITVWDWPGTPIETTRGPVPYKDWCEDEAKRINGDGDVCHVAFNKHGACCVARGYDPNE